jgi:AraC family carnitine catabolism transcriptional activator
MTSGDEDEPAATRVHCVLLPRFNMLSLTGLIEPMRVANYLSLSPLFGYEHWSFDGEEVMASNGMAVVCRPPPEKLGRDDMVFLFGSWGGEYYRNPRLFSWLRLQARLGVRLCAVEIGSYPFARAGLLDDKAATTHWSYVSGFEEQFDTVAVCEQLFTIDGRMMTCAGGTATIDMMLHLIGERHGERLAGEIADQMMHHPVRPATTAQRMTLGRGVEMPSSGVREAVELIERNVSEPLTVPEIAAQVGISQRQLERQFRKIMGCSVVQFGLLMRLQRARVLLISTGMSVREISAACGFNSLSHFAYAFKKCFGKRPSDYRQAWPEQEAEPHWPGSLARYLDTLHVRRATEGDT